MHGSSHLCQLSIQKCVLASAGCVAHQPCEVIGRQGRLLSVEMFVCSNSCVNHKKSVYIIKDVISVCNVTWETGIWDVMTAICMYKLQTESQCVQHQPSICKMIPPAALSMALHHGLHSCAVISRLA